MQSFAFSLPWGYPVRSYFISFNNTLSFVKYRIFTNVTPRSAILLDFIGNHTIIIQYKYLPLTLYLFIMSVRTLLESICDYNLNFALLSPGKLTLIMTFSAFGFTHHKQSEVS